MLVKETVRYAVSAVHAHCLCFMSEVQSAIRVGDVFAVLVEYYYMQRNMEQAFRLIENMRQRGIVLAPFLDADLINTVYRYYNDGLCTCIPVSQCEVHSRECGTLHLQRHTSLLLSVFSDLLLSSPLPSLLPRLHSHPLNSCFPPILLDEPSVLLGWGSALHYPSCSDCIVELPLN